MFGTIFAGGVHDFLSGMLSVRNDGASISEIVGIYFFYYFLATLFPIDKIIRKLYCNIY